MDALSDVLRAVRLTGAIFFDVHASEPWVAQTPAGPTIVNGMFPGAQHLVSYHVITSGGCWVEVEGEPPLRLEAGDVIVFPHGDAHAMSSTLGMRNPPDLSLYRRQSDRPMPFRLSVGDAKEESAHFVCGFLGCDASPFNPLLSALPRVIRVSEQAGGAIGAFVQFAVAEAKDHRPGGEAVLGRLSELMFLDVVRRYLESLPPDQNGWLAGLRDPVIGRAISALHQSPAQDWTLDSLSREVAISRSVLAEKFTQLVGHPPMQYLTHWRMQLASNYLQGSTDSVATIAERVGYESEAAFSRAFKKIVGVPPSQWRAREKSA